MTKSLLTSRLEFSERNPEKLIEVKDRQWKHIRVGSTGPALVLLPGTLGRSDIFWQQISDLRDRCRILSLSYPKTGSLSEWVDDILALVDQFDMQDACILGSSLGGYIAQSCVSQRPGRFSCLMAANTLCSVEMLASVPPYKYDLDNEPIENLRAGFMNGLSAWATENPEYAQLIDILQEEVNGRIPEVELRARLKALKFADPISAELSNFSNIAVIESDDDQIVPPPLRAEVHEVLKPHRVFWFGKGGHFPYVLRPKEYTAILETCLGLEISGFEWPAGHNVRV